VADQASERVRIAAPAQRCFDVAVDFENYPRWARDVKRATIASRDGDGRAKTVEYRAAALGKSVEYTLEYDFSDAPHSFSWHLVEGGFLLRRLDGSYRFEPDGADATRVHYELAVELKAPLPRMVKHRAAALIMGNALRELKREVETITAQDTDGTAQ
jgi:ribosome-associated toxin RatA of RatAB toxin-antitoxin module